MKFIFKIKSENAAFSDSPEIETMRLLRQVADRLESGAEFGVLVDYNGNHVGHWDMDLPEVDDDDA